MAALATLLVRVSLAIACALGATSLIFAVWAVARTGTQFPPLAAALSASVLALAWFSIIANTVISAREIPKDQRNPLSTNAALYRRFARRSSHRVRAILATVSVLGSILGAKGIVTSTPIRLVGGVIPGFVRHHHRYAHRAAPRAPRRGHGDAGALSVGQAQAAGR